MAEGKERTRTRVKRQHRKKTKMSRSGNEKMVWQCGKWLASRQSETRAQPALLRLFPQPRHRPPANVSPAEAVGEVDCIHGCVSLLLRLQNIVSGGCHAQHPAARGDHLKCMGVGVGRRLGGRGRLLNAR